MRGRKPIPTAIKKKAGDGVHDSGGRKLPETEPVAPVGRPDRPKHLTKSAAREWDRLCDDLAALGVLALTDRAAIAMCAELLGIAADAYKVIEKEGMTTPTATGITTHPAVRTYTKATAQAKGLLVEFGLSPSARSRVKVDKPEQDPSDFSDLDGGGK